jgi:hypothetical protein
MSESSEHLALPRHPRFVDFDGRSFTAAHLRQLAASPSIVRLDFKNCDVGDDEVRTICGLPKLQSLWLEGTRVTDAVLPALARLPKLDWLILDRTRVTGTGFASFAGHETLRTLWLADTHLTDETMPLLAAIPSLSIVVLRRTKISRAGLMLLATHPTVEVTAEDLFSRADMKEFELAQRRHANRTAPSFQPVPADAEAAAAVLHTFFSAMLAWERELTASDASSAEAMERHKAACRKIFDQYCTPKERSYGRPNVLWANAEYANLDLLDSEWLTPRKVFFYTKEREGFEGQHRFLVVKRGDRWLIDHKEVRGEGWERDYL